MQEGVNSGKKKKFKLKIDRKKFLKLVKKQASYLVTTGAVAIVFLFFGYCGLYLGKEVSENLFEIKSFPDILLLSLWIVGGLYPLLYFNKQRDIYFRKYRPFVVVAAVFLETIFLSTIPALIFFRKGIDAESVKKMIQGTYISYYSVFILLVIGLAVLLVLTKQSTKSNNWWMLICSLPFMAVGWIAQRDFLNFDSLVKAKGFSASTASKMLKESGGDLNAMNNFWYKLFAILIFVLMIRVGMGIGNFVWNKTKQWRGKSQT